MPLEMVIDYATAKRVYSSSEDEKTTGNLASEDAPFQFYVKSIEYSIDADTMTLTAETTTMSDTTVNALKEEYYNYDDINVTAYNFKLSQELTGNSCAEVVLPYELKTFSKGQYVDYSLFKVTDTGVEEYTPVQDTSAKNETYELQTDGQYVLVKESDGAHRWLHMGSSADGASFAYAWSSGETQFSSGPDDYDALSFYSAGGIKTEKLENGNAYSYATVCVLMNESGALPLTGDESFRATLTVPESAEGKKAYLVSTKDGATTNAIPLTMGDNGDGTSTIKIYEYVDDKTKRDEMDYYFNALSNRCLGEGQFTSPVDASQTAYVLVTSESKTLVQMPAMPMTKNGKGTQTLTFNGDELSPFKYDSNLVNLSEDSVASATDAGDYSIKTTLKDPENTCWADGTTGEKTLNWSIDKATLKIQYKGEKSLSTTRLHWKLPLMKSRVRTLLLSIRMQALGRLLKHRIRCLSATMSLRRFFRK